MTIGIYSLYWEEPDLIYIGLSSNIERRFRAHIYTLELGVHDNFKVQNTFNKYGIPTQSILEECSVEELNDRESYWITEFNSINLGLNIIEGGGASYGCNHTTSKYSKMQILKVLVLLAKTDNTINSISERTKVQKSTVSSIINKKVHTWLHKYPEYYALATRNRTNSANYNRAVARVGIGTKKYSYTFISPTGDKYEHICVSSFIREIGCFESEQLAKQGFSNIIHGRVKTYKKWKCIRNGVH